MAKSLLSIEELRTHFFTDEGVVRAVDGVSVSLDEGDTLGLVGESGCGKTMTALSILRLVPSPPGRIVGGRISFDGRDLLNLPEPAMRKIRGNEISMIFQEPMTSLNPVFRVGDQIAEAVRLHQKVGKRAAWDRTVEMLQKVGIPAPERRAREYPHQLSGGMRQRVMIAMALSCNPRLMIADEPTTALDVTIQAQILDLIERLKDEIGMSVILITHNLGIVAETARHVAVMYAGKIVEYADVQALFGNPQHPYTIGLLRSLPRRGASARRERLEVIPGLVPSLQALPPGCKFNPRCKEVIAQCREEEPELKPIEPGHLVRCLRR
ncbi:MAG: ABC transporter ATP-binding protein [Deltaproteobacteria bacterium]|nr:ABC transporter ATP-binding protein [Deltaproteobacteria bacterium]